MRAAVNLSSRIGRRSVEEMLAMLPDLREAAADIEAGLRHARWWTG